MEQDGTMMIIADTHVHFYPHYQPGVIHRIAARMDKMADGAGHMNILCLAERRDCQWLKDLKEGRLDLPAGCSVKNLPTDSAAVVLTAVAGCNISVIAGKQIVTAERLEILALACDADVRHGVSARDTIEEILTLGGVPVLAWAPGKWMFHRGDVVADLIKTAAPGRLLICDPAIRPSWCPEPALMRLARSRGLTVIHGSDPLPLHGEEELIGTWCSMFDGDFDLSRPAWSMRRFLLSGGHPIHPAGRRCSPLKSLSRLINHRISGK